MKNKSNKLTTKNFTIGVILLLVLYIFVGILWGQAMLREMEAGMVTQASLAAAYLKEKGVSETDIAKAYQVTEREVTIEEGEKIVGKSGYSPMQVMRDKPLFVNSVTYIISACFICALLFIYIFIFYFLRSLNQQIGEAMLAIKRFMNGDEDSRIDTTCEGSLSLMFSYINDLITSLLSHMESEKRAKEFLKDMISDISHQLKTPITAIKMNNEIIIEHPQEKETVVKFSSKIFQSIERIERLIKNLLIMARLDADTIVFDKKEVACKAIAEKIRSAFEVRAEMENKKLQVEGLDEIKIVCDEVWMEEAISNLVKNALDHTEEGDSITLSYQKALLSTVFEVRDTGKGIHQEDIYHIFKRFYRSRFSSDKEGAGLGLPLTKAIIEAHNGMISVSSERGQGTVFTITFHKDDSIVRLDS